VSMTSCDFGLPGASLNFMLGEGFMNTRYRVFLVDDSEDDRLFLRKALERSSKLAVASEFFDGEDFISRFKEFQGSLPDAVLLDIKMPRKNGFEVLGWLKSQQIKDIKVIMVSGSWLHEDINKSLELGACAYFKKTSARAEQDAMVKSIEEILEGEPCPLSPGGPTL